jgi:hypothetical protein
LLGDHAQLRALRVAYGGAGASPLFLAGLFDGTLTFGTTPYTNQGGLDVFLAKFADASDVVAGIAFGSNAANMDQDVRGLAADASGNVLVVGTLRDQATLGNITAKVTGGDDAYVAKLDADLQPKWFLAYGDGSDQGADAVAVAGDGGIIVAGHFQGTIDFGNGFKPMATGGTDLFIVKLVP